MDRLLLKQFKAAAEAGNPGDVLVARAASFDLDPAALKQKREGGMEIPFKISTEAVDREGDTIALDGWDLSDFEKGAGTVLFAHDSRNPAIADPVKTWIGDGALRSVARFPSAETYEFGNMIGRMILDGIMKGASVGFIPLQWLINEERSKAAFGVAIDFIRQKLIEWSVTPLPANAEALAEAAKNYNLRLLYDWAERQLSDKVWQLPYVGRDEVIAVTKSLALPLGISQPSVTIEIEPLPEDATIGAAIAAAAQGKTVITWASAHPDGTPVAARDEDWDGPGEIREAEISDLQVMSAWRAEKPADELVKGDFKLPHHKAAGEHSVVWRGVTAAMGALLGARGGVDVPDGDRKGIYDHLARHYRDDFDEEPPEFRAADEDDDKAIGDRLGKALDEVAAAEDEIVSALAVAAKAIAAISKRGRVLSQANEQRIRDAVQSLSTVLETLPSEGDGDGGGDDDKTIEITPEVLEEMRKATREAVDLEVRRANGSLD